MYGLNKYMIDINIETLAGTSFSLKVSPLETVQSVKAKIQRHEGIPISQQQLVWQSSELDDKHSLNDYHIPNGATIRLVLTLRGGPINTRRVTTEDSLLRDVSDLMEIQEDSNLWNVANNNASNGSTNAVSNGNSGNTESSSHSINKHVTLLLFRDGDQLNLLRVIDRGDASSPVSGAMSAASMYVPYDETDHETAAATPVATNNLDDNGGESATNNPNILLAAAMSKSSASSSTHKLLHHHHHRRHRTKKKSKSTLVSSSAQIENQKTREKMVELKNRMRGSKKQETDKSTDQQQVPNEDNADQKTDESRQSAIESNKDEMVTKPSTNNNGKKPARLKLKKYHLINNNNQLVDEPDLFTDEDNTPGIVFPSAAAAVAAHGLLNYEFDYDDYDDDDSVDEDDDDGDVDDGDVDDEDLDDEDDPCEMDNENQYMEDDEYDDEEDDEDYLDDEDDQDALVDDQDDDYEDGEEDDEIYGDEELILRRNRLYKKYSAQYELPDGDNNSGADTRLTMTTNSNVNYEDDDDQNEEELLVIRDEATSNQNPTTPNITVNTPNRASAHLTEADLMALMMLQFGNEQRQQLSSQNNTRPNDTGAGEPSSLATTALPTVATPANLDTGSANNFAVPVPPSQPLNYGRRARAKYVRRMSRKMMIAMAMAAAAAAVSDPNKMDYNGPVVPISFSRQRNRKASIKKSENDEVGDEGKKETEEAGPTSKELDDEERKKRLIKKRRRMRRQMRMRQMLEEQQAATAGDPDNNGNLPSATEITQSVIKVRRSQRSRRYDVRTATAEIHQLASSAFSPNTILVRTVSLENAANPTTPNTPVLKKRASSKRADVEEQTQRVENNNIETQVENPEPNAQKVEEKTESGVIKEQEPEVKAEQVETSQEGSKSEEQEAPSVVPRKTSASVQPHSQPVAIVPQAPPPPPVRRTPSSSHKRVSFSVNPNPETVSEQVNETAEIESSQTIANNSSKSIMKSKSPSNLSLTGKQSPLPIQQPVLISGYKQKPPPKMDSLYSNNEPVIANTAQAIPLLNRRNGTDNSSSFTTKLIKSQLGSTSILKPYQSNLLNRANLDNGTTTTTTTSGGANDTTIELTRINSASKRFTPGANNKISISVNDLSSTTSKTIKLPPVDTLSNATTSTSLLIGGSTNNINTIGLNVNETITKKKITDLSRYCSFCKRKTGLASSYLCRCGNNYCTQHRNAEAHNCSFDYKTEGRKLIEQSNPLVAAPKLPKI